MYDKLKSGKRKVPELIYIYILSQKLNQVIDHNKTYQLLCLLLGEQNLTGKKKE